MKQLSLYTRLFYFLLILSLSGLVFSCRSLPIASPYQQGQTYQFGVTVWDDSTKISVTDTLLMTVKNRGLIGGLLGMHLAEWESASNPALRQVRGLPISEDRIEIQLPVVFQYFEKENIVIAGYPAWSRSMQPGFTSTSDHRFVRGYGKLSGKRIIQVRTVQDSTWFTFRGETLRCKVSKGYNETKVEELGRYTIRTIWHERYGFLKITVNYPNGKRVVMEYLGRREE